MNATQRTPSKQALATSAMLAASRSSGRKSRMTIPGLGHSVDTNQLHDSTGHVPVLHVEVAVSIPVGSMRAAENTFDPFLLRNLEVASPLRGQD